MFKKFYFYWKKSTIPEAIAHWGLYMIAFFLGWSFALDPDIHDVFIKNGFTPVSILALVIGVFSAMLMVEGGIDKIYGFFYKKNAYGKDPIIVSVLNNWDSLSEKDKQEIGRILDEQEKRDALKK